MPDKPKLIPTRLRTRLLLDTTTTDLTTPARRDLPIRRWRPCTPIIAIAPRLKLNRQVRKPLHDARFASDLSLIPKRAYDEHKIHQA